MLKNMFDPRRRYRLVTLLMLVVGLGSSLIIYLTAGISDESDMVAEFEESKRLTHDLEIYGGKANVLATRFIHWFEGLWHGRSLAYTVAVLTMVVSVGYFAVARRLAALDTHDAGHGGSSRDDHR